MAKTEAPAGGTRFSAIAENPKYKELIAKRRAAVTA